MWHLKTKLGTFWVVETNNEIKERYFLGINDQELGIYDNSETAAKDVHEQSTGYFKWDSQAKVNVPDSISQWTEGEPENWHN